MGDVFFQPLKVLKNDGEQAGMVFLHSLELLHFAAHGFVAGQHFAQSDKSSDDENVHLHRPIAVEH